MGNVVPVVTRLLVVLLVFSAGSELGEESRLVHVRDVRDAHRRTIAVMTHNTDVTNSWEREY